MVYVLPTGSPKRVTNTYSNTTREWYSQTDNVFFSEKDIHRVCITFTYRHLLGNDILFKEKN